VDIRIGNGLALHAANVIPKSPRNDVAIGASCPHAGLEFFVAHIGADKLRLDRRPPPQHAVLLVSLHRAKQRYDNAHRNQANAQRAQINRIAIHFRDTLPAAIYTASRGEIHAVIPSGVCGTGPKILRSEDLSYIKIRRFM
jgi:hypothetical protein